METTVAALYVESGGCYYDLAGVIPWDERKDARNYKGGGVDSSHRISTPLQFRTLLINLARSVKMNEDERLKEQKREQRRRSKTRFKCPSCGQLAWAKESADLGCWKCGVEMVDTDD